MAIWDGYILLKKPALITMAQWRAVLLAIYPYLNRAASSNRPYERLHYRLSPDSTQVVIQASFERDNLNVTALAPVIRVALNNAYTVNQIKTAMQNNITVWPGDDWRDASQQARDYMRVNGWESGEGGI